VSETRSPKESKKKRDRRGVQEQQVISVLATKNIVVGCAQTKGD